jgi:hypothetical protein
LPYQIEIAIVIAIVFGVFILTSLLYALHYFARPQITESHLIYLLIIEPVLAAAALGFLRLRGWRFSSLGLRVTFKGFLEG